MGVTFGPAACQILKGSLALGTKLLPVIDPEATTLSAIPNRVPRNQEMPFDLLYVRRLPDTNETLHYLNSAPSIGSMAEVVLG